jgi:hypothetical protein
MTPNTYETLTLTKAWGKRERKKERKKGMEMSKRPDQTSDVDCSFHYRIRSVLALAMARLGWDRFGLVRLC